MNPRTQQGRQREPNVKTLRCHRLRVEWWNLTPCFAPTSAQRNENINKYLISSSGDRNYQLVDFTHTLCPRATTGLKNI